ncbi:MAG: LamG domain-containing protein [Chloroflexi bacterium]|nr:LamG domain-containing protein [Chloroflexota bacterium]
MNGTTDYITYPGGAFFGPLTNISYVVEFNPSFAHDDNATHILVTTNSHDYAIQKRSDNTLRIYIGNSLIANVAAATYGSYWLVGQRNVIVVSSETGNTSVWLNGTLVLDSDASAWTPTTADPLISVGATVAGANLFDGSISRFAIFSQLLTAAEAADYYNETTWTWRERALVELPMLNANVSGNSTTNVGAGGSAYDAVYGDGSTGSTFPTKSTWRKGYEFDGSDTYLKIADLGTFDYNADFSWFTVVTLDQDINSALFGTRDAFNDGVQLVYIGGSGVQVRYNAINVAAPMSLKQTHTIVLVCDVSGDATIYIDGVNCCGVDISGETIALTENSLLIGAAGNAGAPAIPWTGDMLTAGVADFALTQIQVNALHQTMLYEINKE